MAPRSNIPRDSLQCDLATRDEERVRGEGVLMCGALRIPHDENVLVQHQTLRACRRVCISDGCAGVRALREVCRCGTCEIHATARAQAYLGEIERSVERQVSEETLENARDGRNALEFLDVDVNAQQKSACPLRLTYLPVENHDGLLCVVLHHASHIACHEGLSVVIPNFLRRHFF